MRFNRLWIYVLNNRHGRSVDLRIDEEKTLPLHRFSSDFLGVPLRVGLSRSIFLGAVNRIISNTYSVRAQKGYSRISLTRFASCIEKISPAITTAPHVTTACAPGSSTIIGHNIQLTSSFRPFTRNIVQNFIGRNGNVRKHFN